MIKIIDQQRNMIIMLQRENRKLKQALISINKQKIKLVRNTPKLKEVANSPRPTVIMTPPNN